VALAPASFGALANQLLIGNFGNGHINAYNPTTGKFVDKVCDPHGQAIVVDGLWSLRVGSNTAGSANFGPDKVFCHRRPEWRERRFVWYHYIEPVRTEPAGWVWSGRTSGSGRSAAIARNSRRSSMVGNDGAENGGRRLRASGPSSPPKRALRRASIASGGPAAHRSSNLLTLADRIRTSMCSRGSLLSVFPPTIRALPWAANVRESLGVRSQRRRCRPASAPVARIAPVPLVAKEASSRKSELKISQVKSAKLAASLKRPIDCVRPPLALCRAWALPWQSASAHRRRARRMRADPRPQGLWPPSVGGSIMRFVYKPRE
jgi:hypothetical protein